VKSAIYEGVVTHRRHKTPETGSVSHRFEQQLALPLLFLDEIDEFCAGHPLWSAKRPNAVWFRRTDFLGDPNVSLETSVRDIVCARLGRRPTGYVAMLANLRTWGWLFNPVSIYYCFKQDSDEIDAMVLEVTSTPWHERHVYVIDADENSHRFAKEMHVSPFLGMDQDYVMSWSQPGQRLSVHLGNRHGDSRLFDANMVLRRRGSSRADLASLVWRRPHTYAVSANIYRQALRLFRKGAPFHPRSEPSEGSTCPVAMKDAVRG
jgi:uncharacterized protein